MDNRDRPRRDGGEPVARGRAQGRRADRRFHPARGAPRTPSRICSTRRRSCRRSSPRAPRPAARAWDFRLKGLMGIAAGAMGGGGLMALGGELMGLGLSMDQIQTAGKEVFAYAREVAGDQTVGEITASIPGPVAVHLKEVGLGRGCGRLSGLGRGRLAQGRRGGAERGRASTALASRTADGIRIEPLYAPRRTAPGRADATGPWRVMARLDHPDARRGQRPGARRSRRRRGRLAGRVRRRGRRLRLRASASDPATLHARSRACASTRARASNSTSDPTAPARP